MRMLRGVWVPCWWDDAGLAAARSGQCELGYWCGFLVAARGLRDSAELSLSTHTHSLRKDKAECVPSCGLLLLISASVFLRVKNTKLIT